MKKNITVNFIASEPGNHQTVATIPMTHVPRKGEQIDITGLLSGEVHDVTWVIPYPDNCEPEVNILVRV